MATLQKIRSHGTLLLLIVGLAMLAFIVGDFLNSGASWFNRSKENVGVIAGEKLSIMDFEQSVNQLQEVYKIETGRQSFTDAEYSQIRNQAWQEAVMNIAFGKQAEQAGVVVTPNEVTELCIGSNPSPLIRGRRIFYDNTGQYNPVMFMNYYRAFNSEEYANNPQIQELKNYWNYWENAIALQYKQQKYQSLLQASIVANDVDAKAAFDARNTAKNVEFVSQSYYSVADSLVSVSNAEIRNLYNKRKESLFKQDPYRSLSYVAYAITPSEEDYKEGEAWINSLKDEFATIELNEIAPLVNTYSDILYNGKSYSKNTVPELYKDFAFTGKAGDVTEVNFADDTYSMARIVENGYSQPDSVKLRVINLPENNKTQIDSILNALKAGATFEDMVARYSGEADAEQIGWLTEDVLSSEIASQAFTTAKNAYFTLPAGMGVQIFQVVDRTQPTQKAKLAILEHKVNPSSKTYGIIYNNAREFILNNDTEDKFIAAAEEQSLNLQNAYRLTKNQEQVNDLEQSRKIVKWAYEAKNGAVSDIFECGKNIVVATLTEINDEEYRPLADVTMELRMELINDKKAELLKKQMAGANSLQELATTLGTDIQTAENVRQSSGYFGSAGQEPALVGAAYNIADNTLSTPIKGNRGVYVINVVQTTTEDATFDAQQEVSQLNQRYSYSIPQYGMYSVADRCVNYLYDKVFKVTDNRANFY